MRAEDYKRSHLKRISDRSLRRDLWAWYGGEDSDFKDIDSDFYYFDVTDDKVMDGVEIVRMTVLLQPSVYEGQRRKIVSDLKELVRKNKYGVFEGQFGENGGYISLVKDLQGKI